MPRTVATIMCFTLKPAELCPASTFHVVPAGLGWAEGGAAGCCATRGAAARLARNKAADKVFIVATILGKGSG